MANVGYATLQIIPSMRGVHQKISADLNGIANQAGTQAGGLMGTSMGRAMSKGLEVAAKATAATVAATTGVAIASLVSGYSRMTTIQDSAAALTISLGDSAAAASLLDDVLGVVRGTPFNLDAFAQGAQQLVGMGIEAEKVPGYLTAIGEASATQGSRAGEMADRLTTVFGQISASGQVSLNDIWRVSDTGVNALAILANHYGVTTDEMKKMVSQGVVPADEALDVLSTGIMEGSDGVAGRTVALAGTMEALRRTVSGAVGGIEPAMARMGAAFIEPFSPLIVAGANALSDTFDVLGERLGAMAARIAATDAFERLVAFLEQAPGAVDGFLDSLAPAAPMIGAVVTGLTLFGTAASNIPVLGSLAGSINPLVGAFAALALATPEAREALAGVIEEAAPLAQELVSSLMPVLADLSEIAAAVLPPAIGLFGSALTLALEVAIPLADIISGLTGFLAEHAELVVAAGAAWAVFRAQAALSTIVTGLLGVAAGFESIQVAARARGISTAAAGLSSLKGKVTALVGSLNPAVAVGAAFVALIGVELWQASERGRKAVEKATETVNEYTESLNIDPTNYDSILRGLEEIETTMAAIEGTTFELGTEEQLAYVQATKAELEALRGVYEELEGDAARAHRAQVIAAAETGVSVQEAARWARELGIDLTQTGLAGQDATQELVDGINEANSAASRQVVSSAFEDIAAETQKATERVTEWGNALDAVLGNKTNLINAEIAYTEAVNGLTESFIENGREVNTSTENGIANSRALEARAEAAKGVANAIAEETNSTEAGTNALIMHREQMIKDMIQAGFTREAAEELTNTYLATPDEISTLVELNKTQAERDANSWMQKVREMPGFKHMFVHADTATAERILNHVARDRVATIRAHGVFGAAWEMVGLASGGFLGPQFGGIAGRDSIPAMLMPGEYVVRKSAVDRLGVNFLDKLNKGKLPGYANGGEVRYSPMSMRSVSGPVSAPVAVRTGPGVEFSGPIHLHDDVDIDSLGRRMAFAASARSL